MHPSRIAALFALFALVSAGSAVDPAAGSKAVTDPALPDGTDAARKQIATFKVPAGLKIELFAAEPMLGSPVAIGLDEKNRVFVAEEYRFNRGTEENRTRSFLLDDDLQIRTPAERLAMYRKHANKFDGGMDWFTKHSDQVRLLEDTKGTGKADKSTVFAGGFNAPSTASRPGSWPPTATSISPAFRTCGSSRTLGERARPTCARRCSPGSA